MKVIRVDAEQHLHWVDEAEPELTAGHVIVEVCAAGVNRADLLQRAGKYPSPAGCPDWMGLEVSGRVAAVGEGVTRWQVGDAVCALLGGGGYAERALLAEDMLMPVPEGVELAEAASLPEVYATAYLNLVQEAGLRPGETVYITAGASGLGLAAIQLAKVLGAAKVITTVGNEEKAKLCQQLGADVVVNRYSGDLGAVFDANPVDIALDCGGGDILGQNLERMAVGGRWILVSTLAGEETHIRLRPILKRGLRLIGSTLRSRTPERKANVLAGLVRDVWPAFADGRIRTTVCARFPIQQAEEAHALLQKQANAGKVILTVE